MNTTQWVEQELLKGRHITKFDLLSATNSVCLAQRIQELRNRGWKIQSQSVKGKGTLVEYWLDTEVKKSDEQLFTEERNSSENGLKMAENQILLGLFGENL